MLGSSRVFGRLVITILKGDYVACFFSCTGGKEVEIVF